jgi:nitroreductase
MDIFEVIHDRRSIRRFKQRPVPDDDLIKILDAGRLAPSSNNSQPWSFTVIKDRLLLKQMAAAARDMIDRMLPFAENEKQAQRLKAYKGGFYTFFEDAPVVIAAFLEAHDAGTDRLLARMGYGTEDIQRFRPMPALQSVSAAVQNMLLAVHALGYGSCWMTGPLVAQEAFAKLLKYGVEKRIVALLPIGVPDEAPKAGSRRPLEESVTMIDDPEFSHRHEKRSLL